MKIKGSCTRFPKTHGLCLRLVTQNNLKPVSLFCAALHVNLFSVDSYTIMVSIIAIFRALFYTFTFNGKITDFFIRKHCVRFHFFRQLDNGGRVRPNSKSRFFKLEIVSPVDFNFFVKKEPHNIFKKPK